MSPLQRPADHDLAPIVMETAGSFQSRTAEAQSFPFSLFSLQSHTYQHQPW